MVGGWWEESKEGMVSKIQIIIQHAIETDFKSVIGDHIERPCDELNAKIVYVYQEIANVPI